MPSLPKKTPKTGSALLGHELRRLRAGRTLREIADLTHEPPLAGRVGTLSEASLSEIESGKSMPTLASLHALSVIYKTPMSQLMAYVTEERVAASVATQSGGFAEFERLIGSGDWLAALSVAACEERLASTKASRIAWRANRASCLSQLGLRAEALALLTECCERSGDIEARRRCLLFLNLANAHAGAGNLWAANQAAREASALAASEAVTPAERADLSFLRAELLIARHQFGLSTDAAEIREAQRLLDDAQAHGSAGLARHLNIRIERAAAFVCQGNLLLADRDAADAWSDAIRQSRPTQAARALLVLSSVAELKGHRDSCIEHLEKARVAAETTDEPDLKFEVNFRLFRILREQRPGQATRFLKACDALFPLLSTRSPLVDDYEQVNRARS
jgi:hypothetical protein